MGTVMQRNSHNPARFFVNGRGVLMERQEAGPSRRTGFSMEFNNATRSEMEILAEMLNGPAGSSTLTAGMGTVVQEWARRCERHHARQMRPATFQEARHAA